MLGLVFGAGVPWFLSRAPLFFDWETSCSAWFPVHQLLSGFPPTLFINGSGQAGSSNPAFVFYGDRSYTVLGRVQPRPGSADRARSPCSRRSDSSPLRGPTAVAAGGLHRRLAHLPALVILIERVLVHRCYDRRIRRVHGDLGHPLITRRDRRLAAEPSRPARSVAALVAGLVIFTGSHNLTLAVGTTFRRLHVPVVRRRRSSPLALVPDASALVVVVAVVACPPTPGALLPDSAYGSHTAIASQYPLGISAQFDSVHVLFDPLRYMPQPSDTAGLTSRRRSGFFLWALLIGAPSVRARRPGSSAACDGRTCDCLALAGVGPCPSS